MNNTTQHRANWSSDDDRPREKMMHQGKHVLSDAELMAIVLGSGTPGESALELCQRILNDHHHRLSDLGKRTVFDLVHTYKGVGAAKASRILATLELGRRRKEEPPKKNIVIKCSSDSYHFLHPLLGDLPYEEFWVLLLNNANNIMHHECIGRGSIQSVTVDVRRVIKTALDHRSTSIILGHNHPSGQLQPSQEDIRLTKNLSEAANLFNIRVLDHLIVCDHAYYSFADKGMI